MLFGTYTAPTRNSECNVNEIMFNGTVIKDSENKSFNWGYRGEGPANLAEYMLYHFSVENPNMDFSECNHNDIDTVAFLEDIISKQNKDEDLYITSQDILNWIASKNNFIKISIHTIS